MKPEQINQLSALFENVTHEAEETEFWYARDLQKLLGYTQWRNFLKVIEKAKIACENSDYSVSAHFADVSKMVELGSNTSRKVDDIMLSRYACYLIAQNGDPRKEIIAFAQTYFALQTQKQEELQERVEFIRRLISRNKLREAEIELSGLIYARGVDNMGFGRIRSKGDQALFGGHSTKAMKKKWGMPNNRPLADFASRTILSAKALAADLTNHNVADDESIQGEQQITDVHVGNNKDVRDLLLKNKVVPENLPPKEDIKKLERRVKREEKRLGKETGKLPKKKE